MVVASSSECPPSRIFPSYYLSYTLDSKLAKQPRHHTISSWFFFHQPHDEECKCFKQHHPTHPCHLKQSGLPTPPNSPIYAFILQTTSKGHGWLRPITFYWPSEPRLSWLLHTRALHFCVHGRPFGLHGCPMQTKWAPMGTKCRVLSSHESRAVPMRLWKTKRKWVCKGRPKTPPNSCSVITGPQL